MRVARAAPAGCVAVTWVLAGVGCSRHSAAPPTVEPASPPVAVAVPAAEPVVAYEAVIREAQARLTAGDPVGALTKLRAVPDEAHLAPEPQTMASDVRRVADAEVVALVDAGMKRIDAAMKREQWAYAQLRLRELLDLAVLGDAVRVELERRLHRVELAFAETHSNLQEIDRSVGDACERLDWARAHDHARSGLRLARRLADASVTSRERVVDVLAQRAAAQTPAEGARTTERPAAKPERQKGRARGGKPAARAEPGGGVEVDRAMAFGDVSSETGERGPEAEQETAEQRVQAALRLAADFQRTRATFNAIVTYLRVLELDPANDTAKLALQALEEKRRALVAEYLAAANAAFLKEDLRGASPFYRRVLLLEPANEEALKGLQMYYNLERIDREARRR